MINVIDARCIFKGCPIQASYNFPGNKQKLYCNDHQLPGMQNVKSKKCTFKGCPVVASFGTEGTTKPLHCVTHKLDNEIDVVSKMCIYPKCPLGASYNIEGIKKAIYCKTHALDGMINVASKKCAYKGCPIGASFNFEGGTPLYCATHVISPDMVNVANSTCKTPLCSTQVRGNKYEGYCLFCYVNTFPDKEITRNYKTKEKTVTDFVKNTFPKYDWITDKKIQDGCSNRRPDILLHLGDQAIIIEIDENQHQQRAYEFSCENRRLMEISKDLNYVHLVFIRFNPDGYSTGKDKIQSCWSIHKQSGICMVKADKRAEWNQRLDVLKKHIEHWINNRTEKTVEIVQLFYNN